MLNVKTYQIIAVCGYSPKPNHGTDVFEMMLFVNEVAPLAIFFVYLPREVALFSQVTHYLRYLRV